MEREKIPPNEDPRHGGIQAEDIQRWQYVCKRFNVPCETAVVQDRLIFFITLPAKNKQGYYKHNFRSLESFVFNFLDAYCYHLEPFSLNFDKYLPRFAKFKEKEIHPWIKQYKELD